MILETQRIKAHVLRFCLPTKYVGVYIGSTERPGNAEAVSRKLRWIVIDEAHSYSGSAAVELGYQIKRILDAFGKNADDIRFACTSATIGGEEGAQSLAEFISNVTGQSIDKIKVIGGKRLVKPLNENALAAELEQNDLPKVERVISLRNKINEVAGMTLQQMWEWLYLKCHSIRQIYYLP